MLEISADDEESRKIAEINPLRYRGYYYDNETGYYYLQSRYYDPDLGRFISADDFNYLNTNNKLSINAYIYCNNNPTSKYDSDGHEALALGVLIGFMCEAVVYSLDDKEDLKQFDCENSKLKQYEFSYLSVNGHFCYKYVYIIDNTNEKFDVATNFYEP